MTLQKRLPAVAAVAGYSHCVFESAILSTAAVIATVDPPEAVIRYGVVVAAFVCLVHLNAQGSEPRMFVLHVWFWLPRLRL